MTKSIDLNSDLGEGFGPWTMGEDVAMLRIVTSANIACGGHAGDPEIMYLTLMRARESATVVGAHPGYADRAGFGRRVIPMSAAEIERMVATQIGALMGAAAVAGVPVRYVKPHGALALVAMDERQVADAIARAVRAISQDLALLVISGTVLDLAAHACGLETYSEVFADRAYLPDGRLVPRDRPGALITDAAIASARLVSFMETGLMPTLGGRGIALNANSVCVHGDSPHAVAMARRIRTDLTAAGFVISPFIGAVP